MNCRLSNAQFCGYFPDAQPLAKKFQNFACALVISCSFRRMRAVIIDYCIHSTTYCLVVIRVRTLCPIKRVRHFVVIRLKPTLTNSLTEVQYHVVRDLGILEVPYFFFLRILIQRDIRIMIQIHVEYLQPFQFLLNIILIGYICLSKFFSCHNDLILMIDESCVGKGLSRVCSGFAPVKSVRFGTLDRDGSLRRLP